MPKSYHIVVKQVQQKEVVKTAYLTVSRQEHTNHDLNQRHLRLLSQNFSKIECFDILLCLVGNQG